MHRLILAALLALAGCAPTCDGAPALTVQLLFGRGQVSDAAWRDFLARSVTPRFPDGLTVLDGSGQWRRPGTGEITAEPSSVVEIVTPATPDPLPRLDAIRAEYKARFAQDSVGLVVTPSCASF